MARAEWRRLGALSLNLSMLALSAGCTSQEAATPSTPSTLPTPGPPPAPTPTPAPAPSPSPTPEPSKSGITMAVFQFPKESKCQRRIQPTGTEDLRVGCSIEVRAEPRDAEGNKIPERFTGNNVEWHTTRGKANITLPWDENPWKRWMTGVAPGPYQVTATITLKDGEVVTGWLDGEIVP